MCRRLLARGSEICLAEQIGLTTLYHRVDDGAYTDLKALHLELDEAVVDMALTGAAERKWVGRVR